jgi:hypothetical protein
MSEMSGSFVLVAILTGGTTATLITIFANWLIKRRQNYLEIAKHRMEILQKYVPLYNKLALYTMWNIAWKLGHPKNGLIQYEQVLYHVCNFLQCRKELKRTLGTLLFDNIEAENIIDDLGREIAKFFEEGYDEVEFSKLADLVENELPYHKFHDLIIRPDGVFLYSKFKKIITSEGEKIEKVCRWYSQLIMFELGHVYKIWYGEEPDVLKLSPDLRSHLDTRHPKYYTRIIAFETNSLLRQ